MKHLIRLLMVATTLVSTISLNATDSAKIATVCKIVAEKDSHYKVIFQANERSAVKIQLFDDKNQVVYEEKVDSDGFIKRFDLTNLPLGAYQFKVASSQKEFTEDIKLGSAGDFNMKLKSQESRKVEFVGSSKSGKPLTLYILDEYLEVVHKEEFTSASQVHKLYNFDKLVSDRVLFVVYNEDQLLAEQKFEL